MAMQKQILLDNARDELQAVLYAVNRNAGCINNEVLEKIRGVYELAHFLAQEMKPDRKVEVEKIYIPSNNTEIATIIMDSEVYQVCYATAGKFKDTEIFVNPNDLTVFQVDFYEKL